MADEPVVKLDRRRYVRVIWFFGWAIADFIWWEVILRHLPIVSGYARRTSLARWQMTARRYRRLAVELGGVLIKLGQFLSIRVDVLPAAVTQELSGLQDEVPAEDPADIAEIIAQEFGRPVQAVFGWFAPTP